VLKSSKPVSLNSLRFSDKNGATIVREDYAISFVDHEAMEKFIQNRHRFWTELYGTDLLIAPHSNETIQEIEIKKVFKLVAKHLKLSYLDVVSRSRKAKYIEARRIAINLCLGTGVMKTSIAEAMGYNHSTIIHHENKHKGYMEVDKVYNNLYHSIYRDEYLGVEEYVLTNLNL